MIQKNNIFLIGDAAGMVKATTGGGIIPGMKAAKTLCDCILNSKNYTKEFKKKVGKSLWMHMKIRDILNKFNDKDYGNLLKYIKQKRIKGILAKNTRESPVKLVIKMLFLEPRFIRFIRKL